MMNSQLAANMRRVNRMSGKVSMRLLLLVLVPVVVLLVSGFFYVTSGRFVDTENAYIHNDKVAIIPDISGNVAKIVVAENEPVKQGQLLLLIEQEPFQIAVDKAKSALHQVETDIATLKASYQEQQQQLSIAKEDVAYAQREYKRQLKLAKTQAVSESILDKYQHNLTVAKEKVDSVKSGLARIKASLAGDPDIAVAEHPLYQKAQAALAQAQRNLRETEVVAPFDGIASKTPSQGQYIDPRNPAMMLVKQQNAWVDANLKETQLTHVREGQTVELHVDAYPEHVFRGYVKSIAAATGSEYSVLPAQNATGNWVKVVQRVPVRIAIENNDEQLTLRAGMSVEVSIDTGWHQRGPDFLAPLVDLLQASVDDEPVHMHKLANPQQRALMHP
ncbi:HlyD family secretion protein [Idiomarina tyrosinivorans]|uniref:HlyD family secretion protein n=1 Tax=Idiomarina tyrosinivorans TaxID=1445662 RepID=A0A432ZUD5_9GAMM|nr:HlyD family secretion protein [Idiomarina tyrosinivorans]RUO81530.1 HlyD family secretion protein [Idiomarina tyrosinivorans]